MWWTMSVLAGVQEDLAAVERQLEAAPQNGATASSLPAWVWPHVTPSTEPSPDGLIGMLSSNEPRTVAVTMLWLADAGEPRHLDPIAQNLGDERLAGSFPSFETEQRQRAERGPHAPEPVTWTPRTVTDIGLLALGRLAGSEFRTQEDWLKWRTENPDTGPRVVNLQIRRELKARAWLESLDPELALRARLLEHDHWGWTEERLHKAWAAHFGTPRFDALLRGDEILPEYTSAQGFSRFAKFALPHASAAALEELWADGSKLPWARTELALALAEAKPTRREEMLKALAQTLPRANPETQAAVFYTIAKRGPPARAELKAVLGVTKIEDEQAVAALISSSRAVGVKVKLPAQDEIHDPAPMLRHGGQREEREKARAARQDCVDRIRAAL